MGLDPPCLAGREHQLERFGDLLEDPRGPACTVVTGLRGVGKTVLLDRYAAHAETAGWLVVRDRATASDAGAVALASRALASLARIARRLSLERRRPAAGGEADETLAQIGGLQLRLAGLRPDPPPERLAADLGAVLRRVATLSVRRGARGLALMCDQSERFWDRASDACLRQLVVSTVAARRDGVSLALVVAGLPSLEHAMPRGRPGGCTGC
jgi:hypothetical protein